MPRWILLSCALLLSVLSARASDVYLPVGGSVGVYRTDTRIFNPSQTKDIQVQAWFLPLGNVDNSGVQPVTITVKKRAMAAYDNVNDSLFHMGDVLGAVRLSSADAFVATQRIYAISSLCGPGFTTCTLGQFMVGVDASQALRDGVVIQLKVSNPANKTNIGAVNPHATPATVVWRVFDRNNAQVGDPKTVVMPPFAVISPLPLVTWANNVPPAADLSDAWASFSSDQPVVAFGSVGDNGSNDPTYVPAVQDPDPAPAQTSRTFDVTMANFQITVSPAPAGLQVGDQVTLRISAVDPRHGFKVIAPNGDIKVPDTGALTVGAPITRTFTVDQSGTWAYLCTQATCGDGHSLMIGSFDVATKAATAAILSSGAR